MIRYSILIQWSDEDQLYVVSLPEFGPYAHTHGTTYQEALEKALELLEELIEDYREEGMELPQPALLA